MNVIFNNKLYVKKKKKSEPNRQRKFLENTTLFLSTKISFEKPP